MNKWRVCNSDSFIIKRFLIDYYLEYESIDSGTFLTKTKYNGYYLL